MRAYATQVEVLRRLRNGGHQYVRVEHVQINDGGQALIGNVSRIRKASLNATVQNSSCFQTALRPVMATIGLG